MEGHIKVGQRMSEDFPKITRKARLPRILVTSDSGALLGVDVGGDEARPSFPSLGLGLDLQLCCEDWWLVEGGGA